MTGRVPFGVPFRVPFGVPCRVPFGVPCRVPIRVPLKLAFTVQDVSSSEAELDADVHAELRTCTNTAWVTRAQWYHPAMCRCSSADVGIQQVWPSFGKKVSRVCVCVCVCVEPVLVELSVYMGNGWFCYVVMPLVSRVGACEHGEWLEVARYSF